MKFYSSMGTDELRTRPELSSFFDTSDDDLHLLIGMTKQSIILVAESIGFTPESYSRKAVFEERGKEDYITAMCGHELTGYDFAEKIKLWMKQNEYEEWSLAEVWLAGKRPGVGMATLFVSHIQAQPLETTLKSVPNDTHLWLDYTILRQCQDDFDPERVSGVIQYISKALHGTHVVLDEPQLSYLKRTFCIFEVACTAPDNLQIEMSEDTASMFLEGAFTIDAQAATSTSEKHKYFVDGYIIGQWGSYRRFNESVSAAFRAAHRSLAEGSEEAPLDTTEREKREEELEQERSGAQEAAKVADEARRLLEDQKADAPAEAQEAKQEAAELRQAKDAAVPMVVPTVVATVVPMDEEKKRQLRQDMVIENRRRQRLERRQGRQADVAEEEPAKAKQETGRASVVAAAKAVAGAVWAAGPFGGDKCNDRSGGHWGGGGGGYRRFGGGGGKGKGGGGH